MKGPPTHYFNLISYSEIKRLRTMVIKIAEYFIFTTIVIYQNKGMGGIICLLLNSGSVLIPISRHNISPTPMLCRLILGPLTWECPPP
jgi:hypothetical protein